MKRRTTTVAKQKKISQVFTSRMSPLRTLKEEFATDFQLKRKKKQNEVVYLINCANFPHNLISRYPGSALLKETNDKNNKNPVGLYGLFAVCGETKNGILKLSACIINPSSPSIKLQILFLCIHTFLTEVVERSC